jgi:hypothetical protein
VILLASCSVGSVNKSSIGLEYLEPVRLLCLVAVGAAVLRHPLVVPLLHGLLAVASSRQVPGLHLDEDVAHHGYGSNKQHQGCRDARLAANVGSHGSCRSQYRCWRPGIKLARLLMVCAFEGHDPKGLYRS